jgi:hypothetical protein
MVNKISLIYLLSLFLLYNSQVTILGPPSVVNKVKELEDGSKSQFIYYIKYRN